ncbi:WD40/YVTN/BNR-like repeat-containing protein [Anaeromicropila herbilytica]|uniref:Sortilin N-terminal domain-containing protein n=1 Tax=Anaeromicropila herbilytica TaxID=2785025 RepID=A0A7R7EPZ1_9FIRM|nr:hypothetical protein [Anaeromicropila herbilytica]BCN32889.1 hypothetical protein bsdtb5_41840 [Anaeromicropila herbilytica]
MRKKIILTISLVICLVACSNQTLVNSNIKETPQNISTTVESSTSTSKPTSTPVFEPSISPSIEPSNTPIKQTPISYLPNPKKKWSPNHGITYVKYKNVGHYDDTEEYVFINKNVGWKGYIEPAGAGEDRLILSKTTDGGKSWQRMEDSATVSSAIIGGDILFINSKVGWIIHNIPQNGRLTSYKTTDGGETWKEQNIDVPPQYSDIQFSTCLPVFFSQEDGIMFAWCKDSSNNYEDTEPVTFITHDGGKTWRLNSKKSIDESFKWSINQKDDSTKVIYKKEKWKSIDHVEWIKIN